MSDGIQTVKVDWMAHYLELTAQAGRIEKERDRLRAEVAFLLGLAAEASPEEMRILEAIRSAHPERHDLAWKVYKGEIQVGDQPAPPR